MQELHLVGFTTERDGLIFSTRQGAKSGSFIIPVDDELRQALLAAGADHVDDEVGAKAAPSRPAAPESVLSPREMQERLRAGWTIEEVAREAGAEVDWVARFAAPVLAEQARVVGHALDLTFDKPRVGPSSRPLGPSVRRNIAGRGVRMTDDEVEAAWGAYQLDDDLWVVRFVYTSRGREQRAEWLLDQTAGTLRSHNRLGSQLGHVGARRGTSTATRRSASRTSAPRKAAGKRSAAEKKAAAKRSTAKKAAARKAAAKKVAVKKVAVKKAAVKKAAVKKAAAKKAAAKRSAAKKKAPAKRSAAKKKAAKKVAAKRSAAKKKAPARKAAAKKKKRAPARKAPVTRRAATTRRTGRSVATARRGTRDGWAGRATKAAATVPAAPRRQASGATSPASTVVATGRVAAPLLAAAPVAGPLRSAPTVAPTPASPVAPSEPVVPPAPGHLPGAVEPAGPVTDAVPAVGPAQDGSVGSWPSDAEPPVEVPDGEPVVRIDSRRGTTAASEPQPESESASGPEARRGPTFRADMARLATPGVDGSLPMRPRRREPLRGR
ncbi:MAG TPA: septation protein SepH [Acidimicrobiales bacterium]|nr:septation protein SepH [Acidimicrobiales bacterium]